MLYRRLSVAFNTVDLTQHVVPIYCWTQLQAVLLITACTNPVSELCSHRAAYQIGQEKIRAHAAKRTAAL